MKPLQGFTTKALQTGAITLAAFVGACGMMGDQPAGPPQFAELMPVAMAPPPPPPAPPPPAAEPPPVVPAGKIYGGHLASYTREADAIRGWNSIVTAQSSIASLKRYLVPADTPKGKMIRIIAGDFPNAEEANRFCTWAKQQRLYCAVMEIAPGGATAMPLPPPARRVPARPASAPGGRPPG